MFNPSTTYTSQLQTRYSLREIYQQAHVTEIPHVLTKRAVVRMDFVVIRQPSVEPATVHLIAMLRQNADSMVFRESRTAP